eukprot:m.2322 g.2322  ORF g.2322 m.2322 type:complete len:55 (-) comp2817_c0_seq1:57-221(-)
MKASDVMLDGALGMSSKPATVLAKIPTHTLSRSFFLPTLLALIYLLLFLLICVD